MSALPRLSDRKFILATDLDGTFLGGSEADRRRLYDWIEENRATIGLVFVTGRDPAFIAQLCEEGVPWPEYAIGDVGTTIAQIDGHKVAPIDALEREIAEKWGDAGPKVKEALKDNPGLTLQPTEFRYRVSFDLDPDLFDPMAKDIVVEMGHDWLISDNKYFDVLPVGVSKGPSLKRLVNHLDIDPACVLAAGDTLNDLSMLTSGLPAVAVGGSEKDLLAEVETVETCYKATAIGAAGILEAVAALDLHPVPEET